MSAPYPHETHVVASRKQGGKRTTFRATCTRGDLNGPSRSTSERARHDGVKHEDEAAGR